MTTENAALQIHVECRLTILKFIVELVHKATEDSTVTCQA